MKRKIYALFFLFTVGRIAAAQPIVQWQKSLGGSGNEAIYSVNLTSDGGFIIAGFSESNDYDVSGNNGGRDCWIVKTDSAGIIQWQNSLGGTGIEAAFSIQQTTDSGYIFSGYTESNDSDVTGNHGLRDYWIVKLNSSGSILWQRALGGTGNERAYSISQTSDGGFIVGGYSDSMDGNVAFTHGAQDYWILKLDSAGLIQWQRSYGGTFTDEAYSIQQTTDGGYVAAGYANSTNGNVTGHYYLQDYWIVRMDTAGAKLWAKCFGGSGNDFANSIVQTTDGGFIVAGFSESNDSDVTVNRGGKDYWILKIDSLGIIQWEKSAGGSGQDVANAVLQTSDGGYIVAGYSNSIDGEVTGNHGDYDSWIIKLDSSGVLQWEKSLGGTGIETASSIKLTSTGELIVGCTTASNDGDVSGHYGTIATSDYWLVKLIDLVNGIEVGNEAVNFQVGPNPFSFETIFSFNLTSLKNISMEVRETKGQLVSNIDSRNFSLGKNEIHWFAKNCSGVHIPPGIYFVSLVSDKGRETKKIVITNVE